MKYLQQLWNWLDGKKSTIGGIFSLLTAYGIAKGWIGPAEQDLFLGISTFLIGLGGGHKLIKMNAKAKKSDG